MTPSIAILEEYSPTTETHIATIRAIEHSRSQLKSKIEARLISTEDIELSMKDRPKQLFVLNL